jgi:hypothetical protein
MSSAADVSAEVTRRIAEIIRVAKTSSNLTGTYVKALKDAAGYITTAWQNQALQSVGPGQNSGTAAAKLADTRMTALEKENAVLRQELLRRTACAHECPRCRGSASDSDRPPSDDKSENARLADLERRAEEIKPSILRAIEKRFGGHLLNNHETRQRMTEHPATSRSTTAAEKPPTPPPRKQEKEEWEVVASKRARRKEAKERIATDVRETAKKGGRIAAPTPPARQQPTQQPQGKTTGLPKPSNGAAAMKTGPTPASRMATLPRTQRTSAVTLTLSEGAKTKAVTGAIIIKLPGDKGREKALQQATHLTKVLDPTAVIVAAPKRTTELKIVGIDISIEKEELRQTLALAAEYGVAEMQVGEVGASRSGLGRRM